MDLRANAIITAVDRFSGPVGRMAGALKLFGTHGGAGRLTAMGKGIDKFGSSLTNLASLGAGFGALGLARAIFETSMGFEKATNRVNAFGELTGAEVTELRNYARALGKELPYNATEALKLAEDLYKAGFNHSQTVGLLRDSMRLMAASGDDVDAEKAAEIATGVMFGLHLPMATTEEAARSMATVVDRLTFAANKSATNVNELGTAFKYAAPFAAQLGLGIDDLSAGFMTMAQSNIRSDEAGVAWRSMLVRLLRPTQAGLQTLARLGINLGDHVKQSRDLNLGALVNSFGASGVELSGPVQKELGRLLKDKELLRNGAAMRSALLEAIVSGTGDGSAQDAEKIATIFNDAFMSATNEIDVRGFLKALQEKGAGPGDLARIFDSRQGSRIATLLVSGMYENFLRELREEADGYSYKVVDTMMQGAYGAFKRFQASWHNLKISLGESGVLDDMVSAMEKMRGAFEWIQTLDPNVRRFGTYILMAAAALPLLGFAAMGASAALGLLAGVVTPAGAAIAAIGYLGYQLMSNWDSVKAYFEGWWTWFENGWNSTVERFQNILERLATAKDAMLSGEFGKGLQILQKGHGIPQEDLDALSTAYRSAIAEPYGPPSNVVEPDWSYRRGRRRNRFDFGAGMVRDLAPAAGPEIKVRGKVDGKVKVEVDVKVDGPGVVTGKRTSGGEISGSLDTGKSMPDTKGPGP